MFTISDSTSYSDNEFVKPPLPKRKSDELDTHLESRPYKSKRKSDQLETITEDNPIKSKRRTVQE